MNLRSAAASLLLAMPACSAVSHRHEVFAIQPLGHVQPERIEAVSNGIAGLYNLKSTILPEVPPPASAYVRERDRYDANDLLSLLYDHTEARFSKVVGVITADIGVDRDGERASGIMGIADLGDRTAVVSLHRLAYGGADVSLQTERLVRVANHEAGHLLGLPHCNHARCLMNDAHGVVVTIDRSTGKPCLNCAIKVMTRR